ncbi:hypothetical protein ACW185_03985 [Limosilactobacillus fermentum]
MQQMSKTMGWLMLALNVVLLILIGTMHDISSTTFNASMSQPIVFDICCMKILLKCMDKTYTIFQYYFRLILNYVYGNPKKC